MNYAELLPEIIEAIASTGRRVTFNRLSSTPADPTKPWTGAGVSVVAETFDTVACFVPVSSSTDLGLGFITDDLLARASEVCLVAPGAVDLTTFHKIVDGGVFSIEWAKVLKPGDTVLLYAFGVKK